MIEYSFTDGVREVQLASVLSRISVIKFFMVVSRGLNFIVLFFTVIILAAFAAADYLNRISSTTTISRNVLMGFSVVTSLAECYCSACLFV